MTLSKKKKEMLKFTDLLDQPFFSDQSRIKNAKNNQDLLIICNEHETFLEMQLQDNLSTVESLKKRLNLLF